MDVVVVVVVVLEPTARTTASSGDPQPRGTQPVREDDAKNQASAVRCARQDEQLPRTNGHSLQFKMHLRRGDTRANPAVMQGGPEPFTIRGAAVASGRVTQIGEGSTW
jgi:hypothetical protein